jgi:hypothetical protein
MNGASLLKNATERQLEPEGMEKTMRGRIACTLLGLLILGMNGGCALRKQKGFATMEPAFNGSAVGDGTVVDGAGAQPVTWVDRHPLLYKPRDVYNNTNHHKVTKVAAATVVGVPMGVVCELGQIVKGCPPGL